MSHSAIKDSVTTGSPLFLNVAKGAPLGERVGTWEEKFKLQYIVTCPELSDKRSSRIISKGQEQSVSVLWLKAGVSLDITFYPLNDGLQTSVTKTNATYAKGFCVRTRCKLLW